MARETLTKTITLTEKGGTFSAIFQKFKGKKESATDVALLRQALSNEKAKILHLIRAKQPESIYELAKLLGRDFKAVRNDIKLLEQLGLIELITSKKNGRDRLRPIVDISKLIITIEL